MRRSSSVLMGDLANAFLGKIIMSDKKSWTKDDIEKDFVNAMYRLSLDYLDEAEKEEIK